MLVSHGGFLHYFTEDWEDSSVYQGTYNPFPSKPNPKQKILPLTHTPGTGWTNTEFRTYEFTDSQDDTSDLEGYPLDGDNASLVETLESRRRRGKDGPAPSREQQKVFYKLGLQGWDDQGLQLSVAEREAAKVPQGKEVSGARI